MGRRVEEVLDIISSVLWSGQVRCFRNLTSQRRIFSRGLGVVEELGGKGAIP